MNYIMESTPKTVNIDPQIIEILEQKVLSKEPLTEEEINIFLDYICYETRCKFTNDINNFSFQFKCDKAQAIITHYLNSLKVEVHPCMTQNVITEDIEGHSFLIAIFNVNGINTPYLVDPTYRQFFIDDKKDYILYNSKILRTPSPGYFIKEEDKTEIQKLLINGYHLLDENIARIYGDSFYNTKTGYRRREFQSISGNIYINSFIKGHEPLSTSPEELENEGLSLKRKTKKM
ncbi:MAG: hypothetical protein MR938_04270 [Tenericutes bacterium]|nr:hypothetical protein [Mycoplasmatota bacterium]